MAESIDEQISALKYDLEKALRIQRNLEQNYQRKKRLKLLEDEEEISFRSDLEKMKRDVASLHRQMASLESQKARKKAIDNEY